MAATRMLPALPLEIVSDDRKWKAISSLSAIGGAIAARKAVQAVWKKFSRSEVEPPYNPADRRVAWSTALQWALASGIGAGIARMVSQRAAAAAWERKKGYSPPGVVT